MPVILALQGALVGASYTRPCLPQNSPKTSGSLWAQDKRPSQRFKSQTQTNRYLRAPELFFHYHAVLTFQKHAVHKEKTG